MILDAQRSIGEILVLSISYIYNFKKNEGKHSLSVDFEKKEITKFSRTRALKERIRP